MSASSTHSNPKPSVIELARGAKRALVIGIGGGGDIIQGIPVVNLLHLLGVEDVWMGGVSCQWWTPDGEPLADNWGEAVMGPTIYDVADLSPGESLARQVVKVSPDSAVGNRKPCEARLCGHLPAETILALGLTGGPVGLAESLREVVKAHAIDLVIGVDIGSDTFHDGKEVVPAKTSMVDFMTLGALLTLDCPIVYGVAGYGGDGEMLPEELDERVGRVMRAGGYLGAHGITQQDVRDMEDAGERYPDPVEPLTWKAAKGELGWTNVWTHGPWGTPAKVTPLGAVVLFFDPLTMAESNSRGILALREATSLAEAEAIFKDTLGQFPESRLKPVMRFFE
ncbi:MAG: DUF1152 domain-containing protein [Opitutales bacterium]